MNYPYGSKYPPKFPAQSCNELEGQEILANRRLDKATQQDLERDRASRKEPEDLSDLSDFSDEDLSDLSDFSEFDRRKERTTEHLRTFAMQRILAFWKVAVTYYPAHEADEYSREYARRLMIRTLRSLPHLSVDDDEIIDGYHLDSLVPGFLEGSKLWPEYQNAILKAIRDQKRKPPAPAHAAPIAKESSPRPVTLPAAGISQGDRSRIRHNFIDPILRDKGWSIPDWAQNSKKDPKTVYNFMSGKTKRLNRSIRHALSKSLGTDFPA